LTHGAPFAMLEIRAVEFASVPTVAGPGSQ